MRTTNKSVAVAKKADRTAYYNVRYSCRTEPPTYNSWPTFSPYLYNRV